MNAYGTIRNWLWSLFIQRNVDCYEMRIIGFSGIDENCAKKEIAKMEYVGKETFYNYKLTQTEQMVLVGVLSMILDGKEIPTNNDETKKLLTNLRDGFSNNIKGEARRNGLAI